MVEAVGCPGTVGEVSCLKVGWEKRAGGVRHDADDVGSIEEG